MLQQLKISPDLNIILRAFLQGKIGVHLYCFGPEQREVALNMVDRGILFRSKENMLMINQPMVEVTTSNNLEHELKYFDPFTRHQISGFLTETDTIPMALWY